MFALFCILTLLINKIDGLNTSTTRRPLDQEDDEERRREEEREREKYVSTSNDIILEHIDFVTLRLHHVMKQTTSNITELRDLQRMEFQVNDVYKEGWMEAYQVYNKSKKEILEKTFMNSSLILNAPQEYHIALVAYSMNSIYGDFNAKTRDLCSGKDIDSYNYKSYFKFLELAIEYLAQEIQRYTLNNTTERILYRGLDVSFALQKGQQLAFQHFISTSRDARIAENFSWRNGSTVFEFRGDEKNPLNLGIFMGIHSAYSSEEEVLLSPLQIFQVDEIQEDKNKNKRFVLKSLSLPDSAKCDIVVNNLENYSDRLKLVVIILGVAISIMLLVFIAGIILRLVKKRKINLIFEGQRTTSELQLI